MKIIIRVTNLGPKKKKVGVKGETADDWAR